MILRENIELFKHFKKYSEEDGIYMIKIIKKASKSQFFYHNLDILLGQAKSFDRMALKEVAELPMNNLIVTKIEDKRTKTKILPKILEKYGMERKKELLPQQTVILNKKFAIDKHKEEELLDKAIQIHTKHHTYQKDFKMEEESGGSDASYDGGTDTVATRGSVGGHLPLIKKGGVQKRKAHSKGKNEKNLIIIVKKGLFYENKLGFF